MVVPDVVEILRELVQRDSQNPPGNEREITRFCKDFLDDLNFETFLFPVGGDRENLVARWDPGSNIEGDVIFSGHLDTVPVGDLDRWNYDPLTLTPVNGKLFGRGSCDMKGAIAALLVLASRIQNHQTRSQRAHKIPFQIALTVDEEVHFQGIKHLIHDYDFSGINGVILGEPTGNVPVIGHKGLAWYHIRFQGQAAHGSRPDLGQNTIEVACNFVPAFLQAHKQYSETSRHERLGVNTVNVGTIEGGEKVNIVPDTCDIHLDCRLVPGVSVEAHSQFVQEFLDKHSKGSATVQLVHEGEPFGISEQHPWSEMVKSAANTNQVLVFPAYTEASLYHNDLGLPTVIIGPGSIHQAHVPNEFVLEREVREVVNIYENILAAQFGR